MALPANILGVTSGTGVEVAGTNQLKIIPEVDAATNPNNIGCVRAFCEYDAGQITGTPALFSPEIDSDYRTRIASDLMVDDFNFNNSVQDTGKHSLTSSVFAATCFTPGQFTTNPTNVTTTAAFQALATYALFPTMGTQTLSADVSIGFSAQPQTNSIIEFGFMLGYGGAATAAPTDGVFIRLTSAGLEGVASFAGTETVVAFPASNGTGIWSYTTDKKYQFIIYIENHAADFWVDDGTGAVLLGNIPCPAGQGRMTLSNSFPFVIRHRNPAAAGGIINAKVGAYSVRIGGSNISTIPSIQGNRVYGSYQGLHGNTLGSLANYANSANPTAAVPTNTTAALGTGLGGQFWETATLAVNTDGIICSFQNPGNPLAAVSKRLVIRGIYLTSYIQTAITGGPFIAQYSLAFGHTAVSLATAEAVAAKAPRRVPLPFTQSITAAQAASTLVTQLENTFDLGDAPIYVNPSEFVALVTKHVGTVATAGVIAHVVTFTYGWE